MNRINKIASEIYKHKESVRFLVLPPGRNILVIAPHPDDEVIGCGGTIKKYTLHSHNVTVIYITDGSLGGSIEKIVDIRQAEALLGLSEMGVANHFFMKLKDGKLSIRSTFVEQLATIINENRPDNIFIPHLEDRHSDHIISHLLLVKALKHIDWVPSYITGYEVWNPVNPTIVVNISDHFETKQKALACHSTQIELYDYIQLIDVLGKYRRILHHPDKNTYRIVMEEKKLRAKLGLPMQLPWTHLEAFRLLSLTDYLKEFNMFLSRFEGD